MFGWDDIKSGASNLFHSAAELAPRAAAQVGGAAPAPVDPELAEQMRDRAQAAQALQGRFKIDDDPAHANGNNVVSSEEYQRIVELYSDIRRGRTDLRLAGSEAFGTDPAQQKNMEAFRSGAMDDIADILQTSSGRELIGTLAHNYGGIEGDHITTIGRTAHGNPSAADTDEYYSPEIHYEPGRDATDGLNLPGHEYTDDLRLRSDVTLYHELVHAYHATHGDEDTETADTLGYQSPLDVGHWLRPSHAGAESQAVGLGPFGELSRFSENMYRGERQAIGASNIGERARGGSDDDMKLRDHYNVIL